MVYKVDGFPGREIVQNEETFLYFGGTAYLGLQNDPEFQDIHIKNIKRFGTNYSASRKANVQLAIYDEGENYLANLIGSESCLTLSSGYLAGQMISRHFQKKENHKCFFAPGTHRAVHFLGSNSYNDHEALIRDLEKTVEDTGVHPVLFLESISSDGKNYPRFDWLKKLPVYAVTLVVDDSHGLGIVGNHGGGVFKSLEEIRPKALVICGSLGKGFGIQGGIVAGNFELINDLRNIDMFSAASPAGPASIATLIETHEIASKKRQSLLEKINCFLEKLNDGGTFDYMPKYPSFAFDDSLLATHLLSNGIIITNFRYPTEKDALVQRIVLSAQHTTADVSYLAASINTYFN